ncbi:MAG TPA: hypothetical protein VF212_08560 [Longimicrobiales bacterium]
MKGPRNRSKLMMLAAAALALACARAEDGGAGVDVARALASGRAFAESLIARGRDDAPLSRDSVVALGYLERLRLGLGSPFRLIDQALRDPRLDATMRVHTAHALLARTLGGRSYRVDPSALDRIGLAGYGIRPGVGRHHLELIESAVAEARDARAGELAVRLAYALAAAERGVTRRAPELAAQAAALIRDREIARADAERLIHAAQAAGRDPIELVPLWRATRRFAVEQPLLAPLPLDAEREALELAPRLAAGIHTAALRGAAAAAATPRPGEVPLLGRAAALRLAEAADALDMPPQTPVIVAVGVHERELLGHATDAVRAARERFAERATNEERLAAEHAILAADGAVGGAVARTTLAAAVGLRPYAQERVWFPGFGGPSTRELEDRYGLASITFDDVPPAWRPYYRRMLGDALADLHRVLPSLDLSGLGIRFGRSQGKAATLAIHDPRRRTIYLPPATGAGTIAHEVAHDLDWQVALRRFRVRGDYGSDRATRYGGGRLAESLRRLTTATLRPPMPGDSTPPAHGQRPAEVFARSLDWFVVVALAHEGRMNGYLSSVQDDLLTGYGTVLPPDITGSAGLALVRILDEVAPIYPSTREAFLRGYGPFRSLTPYDLVRSVVESPVPEDSAGARTPILVTAEAGPAPRMSAAGAAADAFAALERARDAALDAIDAWTCRLPAAAYDRDLEIARRRLVAEAAAARARGIALRYAEEIAGPDGRRWLAYRFRGAPSRPAAPDDATAALLESLADRARAAADVRIRAEGGMLGWLGEARACGEVGWWVGG